jgi:hypothetical protein
MNSRERLTKALNHEETDRPPLDLGATAVTGIHASTLYKLRAALGLESRPVTVHEPFQMLGRVDDDVRAALGVDVVGLDGPGTFFGYRNENWKPWQLNDGTPVLMGGGFEYDRNPDGAVFAYPQGDRSCKPSVKMPAGGWFFDAIDRAGPMNEDDLDAKRDYSEQFSLYSEEDARYFEAEARRLAEETSFGVIGNFGGAGFGDVAHIPGPGMKNPRGIRRMDDWLVAHMLYPDYILEVFELQADAALKNLEVYRQAVGDRIQAVFVSGTDFGTQTGLFMSKDSFRNFYKPFLKRINDWIHQNTSWKTFHHSCGSIIDLLDDMADCGVDITNPVQCSATGMEPAALKQRFGDRLVFWGGVSDTQKTLPFGTPEEVRQETAERIRIFAKSGGFVFNTIHNVQANTPVENLLALYGSLKG